MLVIYLSMLLACFGLSNNLADDDPLQVLMDRMAAADCCRFEFISILESDVLYIKTRLKMFIKSFIQKIK